MTGAGENGADGIFKPIQMVVVYCRDMIEILFRIKLGKIIIRFNQAVRHLTLNGIPILSRTKNFLKYRNEL